MEFAGGPPGMPSFASYILQRIWEVNTDTLNLFVKSKQMENINVICSYHYQKKTSLDFVKYRSSKS